MDQRAFPRLTADLRIQIRAIHPPPADRDERVKDVSLQGVRLAIEDGWSEGQEVELNLQLPEEYEPLTARGTIVWIAAAASGRGREAGIAIKGLSDDDTNRLYRYLIQ